MRIAFLGSGSRGNATAVSHAGTTLLIDCGFSARETGRRLLYAGIEPSSVDALLVTHEHTDHVRGIDVFVRRHPTEVFATSATARAASLGACHDLVILRHGDTVRVGGLEVTPFATSHDASDPSGYVIEADGVRFGLATDLGWASEGVCEALSGCDLLAIESNHDVDMLLGGPYPGFLKRRILSERGHLSNVAAADLLERLASDRLRRVLGMHLSEKNNTPALAASALSERAARLGLGIEVGVVAQNAVAVCELC